MVRGWGIEAFGRHRCLAFRLQIAPFASALDHDHGHEHVPRRDVSQHSCRICSLCVCVSVYMSVFAFGCACVRAGSWPRASLARGAWRCCRQGWPSCTGEVTCTCCFHKASEAAARCRRQVADKQQTRTKSISDSGTHVVELHVQSHIRSQ